MSSGDELKFKNYTATDLHDRLAHLGVDARTARRLQAEVLLKSGSIPHQMSEVPKRVLEAVRSNADIPRLERLEKIVSPTDGFAKYAFKGDGDGIFEAVRIPVIGGRGDAKYVVCVSSQIGCAMGCTFCATGRMGFTRNLETWEIVDQVMHIRDDSPDHPVRGVVFMGMGEPMLNYANVMRAAEILSEPCGLAINAKAITISTVGIVPGIRKFTAEKRPFRLVVSLTAADSAKRVSLFPVEKSYPLEELIEAVREYQQATGNRMNLAWTMLGGINTSRDDAKKLALLTAGIPIRIDLIDVTDPTGQFHPPTDEEREAFHDALRAEVGMPVGRRYSGGADIQGACGLLAGKLIQKEAVTTESR